MEDGEHHPRYCKGSGGNEKNVCIMTECQFTRLAVPHFFDTVALNKNSDAKLLIIDIRYDSSVIELVSQLFIAGQKYPTRKCINIISNKASITVNRCDLNVIYEDESLEEFIKKQRKWLIRKVPVLRSALSEHNK